MKMSKNRTGNKRVFALSFIITFCILLTLVSVVSVDYQCRKMALGDSRPVVEKLVETEDLSVVGLNVFGGNYEIDITSLKKIWHDFLDFCCLPHK